MTDFFKNLRARRSVLKRTRTHKDLPPEVFYLEWLPGEGKRRFLDAEGQEHLLADKTVESNYKLLGKGPAKKLIDSHWAKEVAAPQEPTRKEA